MSEPTFKVLGLDLSLGSPGWCQATGSSGGVTTRTGTIKPPSTKSPRTFADDMDRLINCRDEVLLLARDHMPDLIVIEDYAYHMTNQSHQLGELGGLCRASLYERGYEIRNINVMHVKQFATGNHMAKKELVLQQVLKRWGFEAQVNDEADAFVLAHIGLAILMGYRLPETRAVLKITEAMVLTLDKVMGVTTKRKPPTKKKGNTDAARIAQ